MSDTQPLESILNKADNVAEEDGSAGLTELISAFGDRAFGPVLTLLGLLALSPFGAIPGIPAVLAVVIVLFAGQILLGRSTPWLPDAVNRIEVEEDKISSFRERAEGVLEKVDGFLRPRMTWATGEVSRRISAFVTVLLALLMIPLEAIPFAVAIPAAGIVLFGIGLTARDGLVMIFGFVASAIAAVGVINLLA